MIYRKMLLKGRSELEQAGIPEAEWDAWLLFSAAFCMDRAHYLLHSEEEIPTGAKGCIARYDAMLKERLLRRPVAYILGSWDFMGFSFEVDENVLIPEQDTETLCEEALSVLPSGARILDLCTGSGCIAVSLAAMVEDAEVWATDLSEKALSLARKNAASNEVRVEFRQGDLFGALQEDRNNGKLPLFDAITCNPPYISEAVYQTLEPEVNRYEPRLALIAEEEGLFFYRHLAAEAGDYLKKEGLLFLEIGDEQREAVCALLRNALDRESMPIWKNIICVCDYNGKDRVVKAVRA